MAETLVLQPSSIDAQIISNQPTTNDGANVNFNIGESNDSTRIYRALIKFDLSSLPQNATISSATLSLYLNGDWASQNRTCRVYRTKRAWIESEVTWNSYSTGHNWSSPGGFHVDDCEQTDIGSCDFVYTESPGWKDFVLTPTTKAGLDLGNGWLLKFDTETDDRYRFYSSEYTDDTTKCPKLTIVYTSYQDMSGTLPLQTVLTGTYSAGTCELSGDIILATGGDWNMSVSRPLAGLISLQSVLTGVLTGGTEVYDVCEREELEVLIDGVNYTRYLTMASEGITIENALTNRMDTATVTLVASTPDEAVAVKAATNWKEIKIRRKSDGVARFAGYIVGRRFLPFHGAQWAFYSVLTCQDYSALLQRTHVNVGYSSKTDAYIIDNLLTAYAPAFNGTTYVSTGKTLDTITFNRVSIFDALQQICERTGYDWYVDEAKCIHYFTGQTNPAPWMFSDGGEANAAQYDSFSYEDDASQVKNRVFVYGGTYLSATQTERFTGEQYDDDSMRTTWQLANPPSSIDAVEITVDAAAMLEGTDGVDAEANVDVLVNLSTGMIRFTPGHEPGNASTIIATYTYRLPVLIRLRSSSSYATYGSNWFDYKIIDRTITSTEEARTLAQTILDEDATSRETISLSTLVVGFRSGQVARVINNAIGLDGYYLINRVTSTAIAPDWTMRHTIDLGEWHGDVVDLLKRWQATHGPQIDVSTGEQLNELLDQAETITVSDAVAIIDAGSSFYWDTMVWGNSVWGGT